MKKIILACFLILSCFALSAKEKKGKEVPKVEVTMPFHKGINLSDWFEPFFTVYDKNDFEDIKSLGVEIVRIPIHFEELSCGKPDYIVPDWIWKEIDKAVEWCTELKMYMIIDFHNDCDGSSKTRPDIEDVLVKIWPQVAERYKDSSEYILYEIYNEPHLKSGNIEADISKWNEIQGRILKLIRTIDSKHTVIVGAENWNNVEALLKLPDYGDDNIIYNFHDYTPFLFTHQGSSWTYLKDLTGIPFPYAKEKMPKLPKNAKEDVKSEYNSYKRNSSEEVLCKPLDDAVKFANKRKVALMCNEYGVSMEYADNDERVNWYRLKNKWMDERNIIRVSWDYKNKFGLFNSFSINQQFPQDINVKIIEAMGYKIPDNIEPRSRNWIETSYKNGAYEIYKNGLEKSLLFYGYSYIEKNARAGFDLVSENGDKYILVPGAKAYNNINFYFYRQADFSPLVDENLSLEFEIKTTQKDFKLDVYFADKEDKTQGKNGLGWRAKISLRDKDGVNDGKWHKVSVPLKEFVDYGAWDIVWYPSEGLFSWQKVERLVFDFTDTDQTEECCLRNIVIK